MARATVDEAGPTTASTSRSIRLGDRLACRRRARCPRRSRRRARPAVRSTPPAALICSTADAGGVDQRLADRRPLAGLGQQEPDPQDAVVGARRLGRRRDGRRWASSASSCRRRCTTQTAATADRTEADRRGGAGGERALHHDRGAERSRTLHGWSARLHSRRDERHRRSGPRRPAAVPGAVGRHRRGAASGCSTRPPSRVVTRRRRAAVALVAVGGYGRQELAPQSDVDVLLLHDGKPGGIDELATALWYPLWDAGLKLGHAVRSLDDQLALAADDLDTATSLLSARPLAGDDELGSRLVTEGLARWRRNGRRWLDALRSKVIERREPGRRRRLPARAGPQGRPRRAARRAHAVVGGRRRPDRAGRRPGRARPLLRHARRRPGRPAPGEGTAGRRAAARGPGRRRGPARRGVGRRADGRHRRRRPQHRLDRRRSVAPRVAPPGRPRGARWATGWWSSTARSS